MTVRDSFGQGPIVICHLFRSCRCALSGMNHPRFSRFSAATSAPFRIIPEGAGRVAINIACANGGLVPVVLQPVE